MKRCVLAYRSNDNVKHQQQDRKKKRTREPKYEDLNRCVNLPISELLTMIIEELIPRRFEGSVVKINVFPVEKQKYQKGNSSLPLKFP